MAVHFTPSHGFKRESFCVLPLFNAGQRFLVPHSNELDESSRSPESILWGGVNWVGVSMDCKFVKWSNRERLGVTWLGISYVTHHAALRGWILAVTFNSLSSAILIHYLSSRLFSNSSGELFGSRWGDEEPSHQVRARRISDRFPPDANLVNASTTKTLAASSLLLHLHRKQWSHWITPLPAPDSHRNYTLNNNRHRPCDISICS